MEYFVVYSLGWRYSTFPSYIAGYARHCSFFNPNPYSHFSSVWSYTLYCCQDWSWWGDRICRVWFSGNHTAYALLLLILRTFLFLISTPTYEKDYWCLWHIMLDINPISILVFFINNRNYRNFNLVWKGNV